MRLPFAKTPGATPTSPTAQDSASLLRQDLLCRLHGELERSRRYGRPLSIYLAAPHLLPGESPAAEAVAAATEVLRQASRAADLAGQLDERTFLIAMPETGQVEAAVAVARWRNVMWERSRAQGGQEWNMVNLEIDPDMSAEELVELARAKMSAERTRPDGGSLLATPSAASGQSAIAGQPSNLVGAGEPKDGEPLPSAYLDAAAPPPFGTTDAEPDTDITETTATSVVDNLRESVRLHRARMRAHSPTAASDEPDGNSSTKSDKRTLELGSS